MAFFQKNSLIPESLYQFIDLIVRHNSDSQAFQMLPHLLIQRLFIDEQEELVLCNNHIGEYNRIAGHVVSADIEQPYNIVQGCQDMNCGALFLHLRPQLGNLLSCGFAGISDVQHPYLFCRKFRAFLPEKADQILLAGNCHRFLFQAAEQSLTQLVIHYAAVKAQHAMFRHLICQILFDGRNTLLPHPEELYLTAVKLFSRLNKVAAVRPESCLAACDHGCSGGACEAGDKLSAFKMIPYILRLMEICCRHQVGVYSALLHQPAESLNPFIYCIHLQNLLFLAVMVDCNPHSSSPFPAFKSRTLSGFPDSFGQMQLP